ncbi:DUF4920 domain-containing protein [uncultured Ferrimonas sp.]|uniref:DUF4920 domain-containing protein n=1 Tax=uncultured Ferrimonas sp. TaxID=432640 RepID=UPI002614304C|nr:DUF4920 domain-containing protein [uncultured Ferrimonas sp.]
MLKTLLSAALLLSSSAFAAELEFGQPVQPQLLTKVSTILATPQNYLEQPVTIEGTIVSVCSKRGCWLTLASDQRFQDLRVKVKDGEMVFPLSAKGRQALATGTLQAIPYSLEQTIAMRARQAEANGDAFDPASVTKAHTAYQLVPTGVKILD